MSLGRVLVAFVAAVSVGCASPVQSYCARASECGDLGDRSEAQCAADEQKQVDDARADPDCVTLADAFEEMRACQGGLSCEELSLDTKSSPCRKEIEGFTGALLNNLGCAFR